MGTQRNPTGRYNGPRRRGVMTTDPAGEPQVTPFTGDAATYLDGSGQFSTPSGGGGGASIELTGDVTAGPGASPQAATIAADAVTNAKLANMAQATIKGRASGAGTGDPTDLTAAQVKTILGIGTAVINLTLTEGSAVLTTGVKVDLRIPVACTITSIEMAADQSGSIELDLWVDTYANFPPTVADTIVAANYPAISAAVKSQPTIVGWTAALAAGSYLRVNVRSCTSITRCQVQIVVSY